MNQFEEPMQQHLTVGRDGRWNAAINRSESEREAKERIEALRLSTKLAGDNRTQLFPNRG